MPRDDSCSSPSSRTVRARSGWKRPVINGTGKQYFKPYISIFFQRLPFNFQLFPTGKERKLLETSGPEYCFRVPLIFDVLLCVSVQFPGIPTFANWLKSIVPLSALLMEFRQFNCELDSYVFCVNNDSSQLAKVHRTFASGERPTGENPIGEVTVTPFPASFRPVPVKSARFRKPESSTWPGPPANFLRVAPVLVQPVKFLLITKFDYSFTLNDTSDFPNRKIVLFSSPEERT
jgi:hypothetical protein